MTRKQLVPFVEGEGDELAVPVLLKHFLTAINAWRWLTLGPPILVGEIPALARNGFEKWKKRLAGAMKRPNFAGGFILLDGDVSVRANEPFCAFRAAAELVAAARTVGAGQSFSLASVFVRQEYESWLIAGLEPLAGTTVGERRVTLPKGLIGSDLDLEEHPRNAKKWLKTNLVGGYRETIDQESLTKAILEHPLPERLQRMRSFCRLQKAVAEVADGIRTGKRVATPEPRADSGR
jgi:hypothetical protein